MPTGTAVLLSMSPAHSGFLFFWKKPAIVVGGGPWYWPLFRLEAWVSPHQRAWAIFYGPSRLCKGAFCSSLSLVDHNRAGCTLLNNAGNTGREINQIRSGNKLKGGFCRGSRLSYVMYLLLSALHSCSCSRAFLGMETVPLIIAGKQFRSRSLLEQKSRTEKFSSHTVMQKAIEASGVEIVTAALRRVIPSGR